MVAGTDLAVTRDEKTGALAVSRVQMAVAQKTSATPPPAPVKSADPAASTEEESITLSPFEVRTDKDNGYGALQSNSLTAFRMDLDKMPATAQVFNRTFIDDMAEAYAWADLAVCRAGAMTIAELQAAGLGAIFVPLPVATDDHQTKNAEVMVRIGAARLIQERDLTPERLGAAISELLADRARLLEMAAAARGSRVIDAAARLADLCIAAGAHA